MRTNRLAGWPAVLDLCYISAGLLAAPYLLYRLLSTDKYREGLPQRLGRGLPRRPGDAPCLWVHGVSVGEVMGSRAFLGLASEALEGWDLAVTTTTRTGQAMARRHLAGVADSITYFPFDVSWAVRRAFDGIRPAGVVLMELELWPGFLAEAARRDVPVALVNGRISERSFRGYRRGGGLVRRMLDPVRLWLVQTEIYAERLRALGVPAGRIRVTGNMKHDNLPAPVDPAGARTRLAGHGLAPDARILLAASTHDPEEERVLDAFLRLARAAGDLALVLVPRHPERGEAVARAARARGLEVRRWSEGPGPGSARVVVVDAIGVLVDLLPAATAVFVGGSWIEHGGQNVLEPAALGRPVFIGPSYFNFAPEVEGLRAAGGLEVVADAPALATRLEALLADPRSLEGMGRAARRVVDGLSGASKKNLDILMESGFGRVASRPISMP